MNQQIQYCVAPSGARIAYSVIGRGFPIIRTSHWLTHLEHDLASPVWRHVIHGLTQHHTLVRYDARGEGMSERGRLDISFDAWIEDLEAVVDALKAPRFALFGASQGAATAIAYAVRHPERVSHLILYGGFARGMARWTPAEARGQDLELALELIRQGWGGEQDAHRQWFTSLFMPECTVDQAQWFNDLQKVSATPEVAERHLAASSKIDVTGLLSKVTTPTLVLHARNDAATPFVMSEEIAAGIPGAKLVALEGENHLFLAGTPAHRAFFVAVNAFLGDPLPKRGALPGTGSAWSRAETGIQRLEQNWLIKVAVLIGAVIGLVLSCVQLWQMMTGR